MAERATVFAAHWIANAVNKMPHETRLAAFIRDDSCPSIFQLKALVGYPQLHPLISAPQYGIDIECGRHPVAQVATTKKILVIDDPEHHPTWNISDRRIKSVGLAPVVISNEVMAVLAFFSETNNSFDETALVMVRRLCESLAYMAGAAWKIEQLQQARSHLTALSKIMQSIHSQTPYQIENEVNRPPQATNRVIDENQRILNPKTLSILSPREQQVLHEFRSKPKIDVISHRLKISPHTVRNHLKSIFQKVGVHSRIELLSLMGDLQSDDGRSLTHELES